MRAAAALVKAAVPRHRLLNPIGQAHIDDSGCRDED
jgi:hypothetical protein